LWVEEYGDHAPGEGTAEPSAVPATGEEEVAADVGGRSRLTDGLTDQAGPVRPTGTDPP
jgi:hypothetical protein